VRYSTRQHSAFSLVEVMVSIFIAMLIVGIAVLSIGAVNEEARIRRAGSMLEATARTALQQSVQSQRDHWIDFSANGFSVGPDSNSYQMPEGGRIELRHWGERSWNPPGGKRSRAQWRFSHQGLCEPLQVRMTLGRATLELQFDPLTGAVAEESLIVEQG
jgi:type II secretory pathway pseudopilin PulG